MSKFGSLLGDVAFTLDAEATALAVKSIPLARIKPDPKNPRKSFDQAQLEELAESIKARGILQPITVRAEEGGTSFIIRYGERRYRAAEIAGFAEINAIVTDSKADENDLLDQVIENDQRADLSASEMGRAVAEALQDGLKATEIAKRLGRPKSVIAEYAALQEMPPFLQELADTVPIGTVYPLYLAWKAGDEQAQQVEAFVTDKGGRPITRAEARSLSREASGKQDAPAKPDDGSEPPLPLTGGNESSAGRTSAVDHEGQQSSDPIPSPAATPPAPTPAAPAPAPAQPADRLDVAPADADSAPNDRARQPARSALGDQSAEAGRISVVVKGRLAKLVLPAEVSVIYDDDGSEQIIGSDQVSLQGVVK